MPRGQAVAAAAKGPMSKGLQRLAGQWVAVEWTTAGELSLAATLTSGQCFRWRTRSVEVAAPQQQLPRKTTRAEKTAWRPQAKLEGGVSLETWVGIIGRHVVELASVDRAVLSSVLLDGKGVRGRDGLVVLPSTRPVDTVAIDPGSPPPLSPLQRALSPRQQLLLVRTWNAREEPAMPALTLREWPSVSTAPTAVATADDVADLARRYLRLDDDMLAAWTGEWLPDGWSDASPVPALAPSLAPATPVKHAASKKKGATPPMSPTKEAQALRIARLLPRDNAALRQRLAANALQVAATATATTTAETTSVAPRPYGVRLLRQDPWENLLSFLCSQNNHQTRIAGMVGSLCLEYGERIELAASQDLPPEWLSGSFTCAFPTASALAGKAKEDRLRELGFGYRAKFIAATAPSMAKALQSSSASSEHNAPVGAAAMPDGGFSAYVASQPTIDRQRELLVSLPGVGRKVADCVLLFAYDRLAIVPIDTHMAQITQLASAASWGESATSSAPKKKTKTPKKPDGDADKSAAAAATVSLTPRVHDAFQAHYTHVFGRWAGWAHCLLFAPRLTTSSITLPRNEPRDV